MDIRVGAIAVLVLASILTCDARNMEHLEDSGLEKGHGFFDVCKLCENYTKKALTYLDKRKTHEEIIESLHKVCLEIYGLSNQCTMLVNYYIPLFFAEISTIKPNGFCKKIRLCKRTKVFTLTEKKTPCDLCHKAMDDALEKLKDPDTELEVIHILLEACDAVMSFSKKCKSLVFEFGPKIIVDAEKYLEKIDLCTKFHACRRTHANTPEESDEGKIKMVTSS